MLNKDTPSTSLREMEDELDAHMMQQRLEPEGI